MKSLSRVRLFATPWTAAQRVKSVAKLRKIGDPEEGRKETPLVVKYTETIHSKIRLKEPVVSRACFPDLHAHTTVGNFLNQAHKVLVPGSLQGPGLLGKQMSPPQQPPLTPTPHLQHEEVRILLNLQKQTPTESGICTHVCMLSRFSRVQLLETPWTVARQPPLSMGFSRQEYCSGLPCPSPGDLPDPGIEPAPPATASL